MAEQENRLRNMHPALRAVLEQTRGAADARSNTSDYPQTGHGVESHSPSHGDEDHPLNDFNLK